MTPPHAYSEHEPHGASAWGSVVLDIGGRRGALLVHVPGAADGAEVEVRPRGAPWSGEHVGVRRRGSGAHEHLAALFGSLEAGPYEIRWRGTGEEHGAVAVTVHAGVVSEAVLPATAPSDT